MEEFRKYNDEYSFSNLGNVLRNGMLYNPGTSLDYYCVNVSGKFVRIHSIIGQLFQDVCGKWEPGYHTHHIDRNRKNNNVTNLLNLPASEHKRLHQIEDGVTRQVIGYNRNGEKVGEWNSLTEAQEATGAFYNHIGHVCKGERSHASQMFWVFKDDEEKEEKVYDWVYECFIKHQNENKKKIPAIIIKLHKAVKDMENKKLWEKHWVYITDVYTGEITSVKCIAEATRLFGVNGANLSRSFKNRKPYLFNGKVFWKK